MLPHPQVVRPCLDLLISIDLALSALETSSPLHMFSETGVPLQNSVSTEFRIAVSALASVVGFVCQAGEKYNNYPDN